MQTTLRSLFLFLPLAATPTVAQEHDAQWPGWRGPHANGTSTATGLPTTWSADENVVWKTELPSWSGATPVVWGERVFVMSPSAQDASAPQPTDASARGRRGPSRDPGGDALLLLALDANDGKILWTRELDRGNRLWRKSNQTSPSPVTDGTTVWATTGTGVVTALDFEGAVLWSKDLQKEYGAFGMNWGYASSPLLHDGDLVVQVLHGSHTDETSYVVAFDGATGDVHWKVDRPTDAQRESPDAYTTPLLLRRGDREQIVITGGDYVTGHDPASGAELWRVAGLNPRKAPNYRVVASPLLIDDLLIVPTRVRPILAIALDDALTPTDDDVMWLWDRQGAPDVPTPTTDGRFLYLVDDGGLITCVDPGLGEPVWGPERTVQGTVSGSPVCADGKVFFTNEEGITVVVRAGETFELLATNALDGGYTIASPAIAGGRIFVRTEQHLFCIGAE